MIQINGDEFLLFSELRASLLPLFDIPIYKGLSNNVAPPSGDYILITPIVNTRQGTNEVTYTDSTKTDEVLFTYMIQIDCYGAQSGNNANIINMLTRGDYFHDSGITPLTCSNPRQLMFEDDKRQMIERWTLDLSVSYNPSITIPIETADTLNPNLLIPVDVFYE